MSARRALQGRGPAFSLLTAALYLGGHFLAAGVAAAGVTALSARAGLSPERALAIAGSLALLVDAGLGFLGSTLGRRFGFWEGLVSALLFAGVGSIAVGLLYRLSVAGGGFSLNELVYLASLLDNPAIGLALSLFALILAQIFGGSLGYLLAGTGRVDTGFRYELFIAKSHLRLSRQRLLLLATLTGLPAAAGGLVYMLSHATAAGSGRTVLWEGQGMPPAVAAEHPALYWTGAAVMGLATLLLLGLLVAWAIRGARSRRPPTVVMTFISIFGVALGVFALTVVLSVMSGFELDLKKKILGTNAHAVVLKYGNDFSDYEERAQQVRKVRGVTGVTPFVLNEVMLSSDQNIEGSLIKGIEPSTVGQVTELPAEVESGKLDYLDRPEQIPTGDEGGGPSGRDKVLEELDKALGGNKAEGKKAALPGPVPGIVLGRELARGLKVFVGDRVNVVSPLGGELGPNGPMPRSRPFRVAGIFYSGMYEYDSKFSYIALSEAQKFFGIGPSVTGLELKVDDIDDTRRITRDILRELDGYPFRTKDWGEMNRNLFSALRLEKLVMAIILAVIVLVACFNIVSTLIMLVLEKSKEIAILKSMGARDTSVMKVFVLEGLVIGLLGTTIGMVLGYLGCLFVERFGIRLDPEVYYISKLPVRVDPPQLAVVFFMSMLLSYLATIYPAIKGSRLPPVEGLRSE